MQRYLAYHRGSADLVYQMYAHEYGLVWSPKRWNNTQDASCLTHRELKLLESVLLASTSHKYDALDTFCRYVDALEARSVFLPLESLRSWTPLPVELDGAYIPYQKPLEAKMDQVGFSVYDTSRLVEVCTVLPRQWSAPRQRRCVLAVAAARESLAYRSNMDRNPLQHPFQPLESAIYKAARGNYNDYLKLAIEFNQQAPIPVLCYRKKNSYNAQELWH